jgi:hypothetical protein
VSNPLLSVCCDDDERRHDIADPGSAFNGIDWIEIEPGNQRELHIGFLHPLPGETGGVPASPPLTAANVLISGGERITGIDVVGVASAGAALTVTVAEAGDFSPYVLRIVRSEVDTRAPNGFDPALAARSFSFKANCASDGDCAVRAPAGPRPPAPPAVVIDYLAKDYDGFRRLMLDRIATLLPDRRETNPADPLVTVVEALAHAADRRSYRQDAVATEAYLDTARSRISVRRHARLVDYAIHDGCTARTWLQFAVSPGSPAETLGLPAGTQVLSGPAVGAVAPEDLADLVAAGSIAFETLLELRPLAARNEIAIHTWGGRDCCLPAGATRATLRNDPPLGLTTGDLLLLEEVRGPESGRVGDADPTRRQVVRLVSAAVSSDPVENVPLLEVAWEQPDALTVPLTVSAVVDELGGAVTCAVARANLVPAHHAIARTGLLPPASADRFRPLLTSGPLAAAEPPPASGAAAFALTQNPHKAQPLVTLTADEATWEPRPDLLASDRFDLGFVVELERGGRAFARFGDDVSGRRPAAGTEFAIAWREGGGSVGNVGRDVLTRVATDRPGVLAVTNPLPGAAGTDPESIDHVRQHAPAAFLTQERAVTPADWVEVAERRPEVQHAAARLRWTGSWWTVFLTLDTFGGRRLADDPQLAADLAHGLDRYRIAGYDLELRDPVDVPIVLGLHVCVLPAHFRAQVRDDLLDALSNRTLPDGSRGLFHPDELTFGQPVYVSRILARVASLPGVAHAEVVELHPVGIDQGGEIAAGVLTVSDLEIARLDNDPSIPERGTIRLDLEGGL